MKLNKGLGLAVFLTTALADIYILSQLIENRRIQRQLSETRELVKEQQERLKERLKPFKVTGDAE